MTMSSTVWSPKYRACQCLAWPSGTRDHKKGPPEIYNKINKYNRI